MLRAPVRRYRTWTVFLVALCCLLALMLVPSLTALRRSEQLYRDIRQMQDDYERNQRVLDALARRLLMTSITMREFFLDMSAENDRTYIQQLTASRSDVQQYIGELRKMIHSQQSGAYQRLQDEVEAYWNSIGPVMRWTPRERAERGSYFLRQEQRPRRQSILAIADEIGRLNTAFYRQQYDNVNRSEQEFRRDLERTIRLALFAGLLVASASILRIAWLERRATEQHEQAQHTGEELRNLSTRLRHAQEEERKTISRELHDDVGQKLTAMRMELGGLERWRQGEDDRFREQLNEVKTLAEESLRTIRDIAAGLRPSVLDDLGLGPALQRQAREFGNRTGTPVSVDLSGELEHLAERHRTCIYRIVQESLTNCAKHANASKIGIGLDGTRERIKLRIEDNGIGFDPANIAMNGLGLIGIEERVRELNGSLVVDSRPGSGTRLSVELPLNGDAP